MQEMDKRIKIMCNTETSSRWRCCNDENSLAFVDGGTNRKSSMSSRDGSTCVVISGEVGCNVITACSSHVEMALHMITAQRLSDKLKLRALDTERERKWCLLQHKFSSKYLKGISTIIVMRELKFKYRIYSNKHTPPLK